MNQMPRYVLDKSFEDPPVDTLNSTGKLCFVDTTGDGVPDAILDPPSSSYVPVDTTGDGCFDALAYDTTGDDFANEVLSLPEGWQFLAAREGNGLFIYNSSLNVSREYRSLSVEQVLQASDPLLLQQQFGTGSSSSCPQAAQHTRRAEDEVTWCQHEETLQTDDEAHFEVNQHKYPDVRTNSGVSLMHLPGKPRIERAGTLGADALINWADVRDDVAPGEATWCQHDPPQTDDEGRFEVDPRKYLDARTNSGSSLLHVPRTKWADGGDILSTLDGDSFACDDSMLEAFDQKSSDDKKRRSLLIAYFPRCADESRLCGALSKFGAVSLIRIIRDSRGVSKCFGFITFEQAEAAEKAIQECQKGRVIITDKTGKKWHMKANWSDRASGKKRRSRRNNRQVTRSTSGTSSS